MLFLSFYYVSFFSFLILMQKIFQDLSEVCGNVFKFERIQ